MSVKSWFASWFDLPERVRNPLSSGSRGRRCPARARLTCEELEPRLAPAAVGPVQTIAKPPGPFGNAFGWSVATSGTEVLIGAEASNTGEAFLFNTSGQLLQTFQDPDPNGSNFGISVALSGSYVLIGADGEGGSNDPGAAYLFNTDRQLLHTFADPSGRTNTGFGFSVAMSGSSVVISAFGPQQSNGSSGAAYLFDTAGNLLKTFFDGSTNGNDSLGLTVALSDSNVLVGVGNENVAYLYSASGQLVETLSDPDTVNDYTFGAAVALSGTNVLVSAPYSNTYRGEAFLYDSSGHLLQTFYDPDGQYGELFGISVALSGNYVLVGADSELSDAAGGSGFPGAAFLYTTSGQLVEEFRDPNAGDNGDLFGHAVALGGSNVLVSGPEVVYLYNIPAAPAVPVVSVNPVNITYGTALANSQLSGTATTTVNGQSVTVAGTFTYTSAAGTVLPAGNGQSEAVTFTPADTTDYTTATTTVIVNVAPPPELSALFGNNETTIVGTAFGTLLEAQVTDASGNPLPGYPVMFTVNNASNGAGASFGSGTVVTVTTNAEGLAIAPVLTADTVAGSFSATASVSGASTTFLLTNISGAPAKVTVVGGNGQSTPINSIYGTLL
jgi:hypothetical protein